MSFESLEKNGLVGKIVINLDQVAKNLSRSLKDLNTAKANLTIDEEWAYAIAYHAMLRAGRALLLYEGYRPKGKDMHKTVISAAKETLGEGFSTLINDFDRMRRKRHEFIYEPGRPIPTNEAEAAFNNAKELVNKIINIIQAESPQMKLF
jgi:uncharacterized protein (UPF0332 family)